MDITEAVRSRRSVRAYKPIPVSKDILREIMEIARYAPSAVNTQPWEITVVTGPALEGIKRSNVEMANSGATPHAEIPVPPYEGVYRQRQVTLAITLFGLMGITKEDKEKRTQWTHRSYRWHDAPAAIILTTDKAMRTISPMPLVDVGAILQTICLVALHYGLTTCIDYLAVIYPEVIRKFTGIPDSKNIVTSIAIGYPDWDFPANELRSQREPVENFVTWRGFD